MANTLHFSQGVKLLPLLAPVAVAEAAVASQYVDLKNAQWATFLVSFGACATTSATDIVTVTVECSTAGTSNATEVAIPFSYRLSSKVGTDSLGAVTAGSSAGVAVSMDDATGGSSSVMVIDVDPDTLPAQLTDGVFLRVVATPSGSSSISVPVGVIAQLRPRYASKTIASDT